MQTVSPWIWTRVAVSTFYDDIHYTPDAFWIASVGYMVTEMKQLITL